MQRKTPRPKNIQDAVQEMFLQGYSDAAIQNRLNSTLSAVRVAKRKLGIWRVTHRPNNERYISLDEAAGLFGVYQPAVAAAANEGRLRCVHNNSRFFTTREWMSIWLDTSAYRRESDKLFTKLRRAMEQRKNEG